MWYTVRIDAETEGQSHFGAEELHMLRRAVAADVCSMPRDRPLCIRDLGECAIEVGLVAGQDGRKATVACEHGCSKAVNRGAEIVHGVVTVEVRDVTNETILSVMELRDPGNTERSGNT